MAAKKKDESVPRKGGMPNHAQVVSRLKSLEEKVAALGNGSAQHPPSPDPSDAAPSFATWSRDALVALVSSEGRDAAGRASIPDTLEALCDIWFAGLVAEGKSLEELEAFDQRRTELRQNAEDWLKQKRGEKFMEIEQRQQRDGNAYPKDQPAEAAGASKSPTDIASIATQAAIAAVKAHFGDGVAPQPEEPALSQVEQQILADRTGGFPTR